jgi:uncharacterized protein
MNLSINGVAKPMRIALMSFCLAALSAAAAAQDATSVEERATLQALVGHWSGELHRGGDEAAFALDLRMQGEELVGQFDWPELGYLNTNILGARMRDGQVRIALPLPLGSLRLTATPNRSRLRGALIETTRRANEWVTLPEGGRFDLRRTERTEPPYRVTPVRFGDGDVSLAGAVYAPRGGGRRPAVVFIHGSGDSDRSDGAFFADRFARSGIVTLVYDKRGVGESSGQWRDGGYEALAADAHAGLELLRTRADVDPDRIGYVARSQGGWVAPLAARLGGAAFLGLLSAPAVSVADEDIDHYRVALREAGVTEADMVQAFDLLRLRHRVLLGLADASSLDAALAVHGSAAWFPVLNWDEATGESVPFLQATLAYDPAPHLATLSIPTYWIYGTDDTIIPAADSVARLMQLGIEPRPLITVLPRADHALAITDYPRLPRGVGHSARLMADWINGLHRR